MSRPHPTPALLSCLALALALCAPAFGQTQLQTLPGPARELSLFGNAVASSPDGLWFVAIGTNGQGYVYRFEDGAYVQDAILTVAPPTTAFGYINDVAISADGAVVAIGSPIHASASQPGGSVTVWRRTGRSWAADAPLTALGGGFGSSVALSQDGVALAVGHSGTPASPGPPFGTVRVYRYDGASWNVELVTSGPVAETLGYSVDLNAPGNRLIVGAISYPSGGLSNAGAARIFFRDLDGTWTHQALIGNPEPSVGARFGERVTLDGDTAVVGSRFDDQVGPDAGAAYVYQYDGRGWPLVQKLTPNPAVCTTNCGFGSDLDLRGDHLLVRAQGLSYPDAGSAFAEAASLYRRGDAGSGEPPWVFLTRIFAEQPVVNPTAGSPGSCALAFERVIIGSPGDRGGIGNAAGVVRTYRIDELVENAVLRGSGVVGESWLPIGCGTVTAGPHGSMILSASGGCDLVGAQSNREEAVLSGDFDVRVGFCIDRWPLPIRQGASRGVYLSVLRANNDDPENTLGTIGRVDNWSAGFNCFTTRTQYMSWYNTIGGVRGASWEGPNPCHARVRLEPAPSGVPWGVLRISRTGSTLDFLFQEDGFWVLLGSVNVDDTAVTVQVWASSFVVPGGAETDPAPFKVRIGDPERLPCYYAAR